MEVTGQLLDHRVIIMQMEVDSGEIGWGRKLLSLEPYRSHWCPGHNWWTPLAFWLSYTILCGKGVPVQLPPKGWEGAKVMSCPSEDAPMVVSTLLFTFSGAQVVSPVSQETLPPSPLLGCQGAVVWRGTPWLWSRRLVGAGCLCGVSLVVLWCRRPGLSTEPWGSSGLA